MSPCHKKIREVVDIILKKKNVVSAADIKAILPQYKMSTIKQVLTTYPGICKAGGYVDYDGNKFEKSYNKNLSGNRLALYEKGNRDDLYSSKNRWYYDYYFLNF